MTQSGAAVMLEDGRTPNAEPVRDKDAGNDCREMTVEADECTPEEAGYGYGV